MVLGSFRIRATILRSAGTTSLNNTFIIDDDIFDMSVVFGLLRLGLGLWLGLGLGVGLGLGLG